MTFLKLVNVTLFLCFLGIRVAMIWLSLNWFIFEPFMNTEIGVVHAFGLLMIKIILEWKDTSELKRRTPTEQFHEILSNITIALSFFAILFVLKYFL